VMTPRIMLLHDKSRFAHSFGRLIHALDHGSYSYYAGFSKGTSERERQRICAYFSKILSARGPTYAAYTAERLLIQHARLHELCPLA
jgi:hypothetical protein